MALTFCHFLLLAWIFESMKSSPNCSKLCRNLGISLRCWKNLLWVTSDTLGLLHSLQDFTYIAFRSFICGIFGDLATDYIALKWFQTLRASPNHSLLMRKLSLVYSWRNGERFSWLTYGSNIFLLSFIGLNCWKFANLHEIAWNFAEIKESVSVDEKT